MDYLVKQILEASIKDGCNINGTRILLYHGTSQKNATKIAKSKKLFAGTWLSGDRDIAAQYSKMLKGRPVITEVWIEASTLSYNGYFSTLKEIKLNIFSEHKFSQS